MTQLAFTLTSPTPRSTRPVRDTSRETARRSRNAERVLERLRRGPATTMELIAVGGARAIGRKWELERAGYVIEKQEIRPGLFQYRLVSEP